MRFLRYFLSWFGGFVQCPYIAEDAIHRGIKVFTYCRKKQWHLGPHCDFTATRRSSRVTWRKGRG